MILGTYFNKLPFFWKVYILVVVLLIIVVSLVEVVLEPIAMQMMEKIYGGYHDVHEVILWTLSLLGPSLLSGYILTSLLSAKLGRMAKVSRSLAQGDLGVRLPVENKDNDPFDMLAHSFNEMADAIESQLQNERRLLADISHELRSPLARMSIAVELLDRKQEGTERPDLVQRLRKEVGHMSELVSLLLAQGMGKQHLVQTDTVDLGEVIRKSASDFSFQGAEQGKSIHLSVEDGLYVQGYTLLLQRALGNLLSNALFYSPSDSHIDVLARREAHEIMVSIRDYGPGVPESELENIFRAFYRVDSSRTRTSGGIGLGLALVNESIVLQGGRVFAENASPGLTVTIFLPLCEKSVTA